ncbi:MAG: hypothetical protein ACOVNU_11715 [Candidatus Kapaibacteriota bacterium]
MSNIDYKQKYEEQKELNKKDRDDLYALATQVGTYKGLIKCSINSISDEYLKEHLSKSLLSLDNEFDERFKHNNI